MRILIISSISYEVSFQCFGESRSLFWVSLSSISSRLSITICFDYVLQSKQSTNDRSDQMRILIIYTISYELLLRCFGSSRSPDFGVIIVTTIAVIDHYLAAVHYRRSRFGWDVVFFVNESSALLLSSIN